ncbi:MAG: hypothetical protein K9G46_11240 [Flavobacteriales bacterium]|nr:hypothetical protein [Flavobacteriales bacterium]
MLSSIIENLFVGVAIAGALAILQRSSERKSAPSASGQFHLKMPMFYGVLGVMGWVFGTFFLSMLIVAIAEMRTVIILVGIGVSAMMFIVGSFCFLYYWNHEVKFDQTSVEVTDHYGNTAKIKWTQVVDMNFGPISGQLTIKSAERSMKVHQHLSGVISLVDVIESTTRWTARELKLPFGRK